MVVYIPPKTVFCIFAEKSALMISPHDLIITLIKHEFKFNKLIFGLTKLGILGECYFPDLENTIYSLLGFEDKDKDEALFNIYDSFKDKVIAMDIKEFSSKLDDISTELYNTLMAEKKNRSLQNPHRKT